MVVGLRSRKSLPPTVVIRVYGEDLDRDTRLTAVEFVAPEELGDDGAFRYYSEREREILEEGIRRCPEPAPDDAAA